jgi:hypothetical protein
MLTGLPKRTVHARQAVEGVLLQLLQGAARPYQFSRVPVVVTAVADRNEPGGAILINA